MSKRFDIAVIGRGPAGAATAIQLSRIGYSVLVLELTSYPRPRVSETLPPTVAKPLLQLGVFDLFLRQGHSPSAGIVSAWGKPDIRANDFLFSTPGFGWQVDRPVFDRMLGEAAVAAGATVWTGSNLSSRPQRDNKRWQFDVRTHDRNVNCSCRFLVDATGRCGTPWLSHLSPKTFIDGLIGIAWTGRTDAQWPYALVESVRNGWFYSASLPDSKVTVVYMTDADLHRQKASCFPSLFWRELRRTHYTKLRFPAGSRPNDVRLFLRCQLGSPASGW